MFGGGDVELADLGRHLREALLSLELPARSGLPLFLLELLLCLVAFEHLLGVIRTPAGRAQAFPSASPGASGVGAAAAQSSATTSSGVRPLLSCSRIRPLNAARAASSPQVSSSSPTSRN